MSQNYGYEFKDDEPTSQETSSNYSFSENIHTQGSQQYSQVFSGFTGSSQSSQIKSQLSQSSSSLQSQNFDESNAPIKDQNEKFHTFEGEKIEEKDLDFEEVREEEMVLEEPEHACFYCGCSNVASVVKCTSIGCNKWFCNGRGQTSASHVVHHLVKSKHKQILLHPKSPLGDTILECYVCGNKNVFLLGFVSSKKDSVVVLLCRDPCLYENSLEEMDWNTSQWLPLIHDRKFLNWLVRVPEQKEQDRSRRVSTKQINKIEEMMKVDPTTTMEDLENQGVEEELLPVQFVYEDGYRYKNILAPLVKQEADYDKKTKESQSLEKVTVKWGSGSTSSMNKKKRNKNFFSFVCPKSDSGFRLVPGDELRLIYHERDKWNCVGHVVKIDGDAITVELSYNKNCPTDVTEGFVIEFVWKSTSFDRMHNALTQFAVNDKCVSSFLYHKILGHQIDQKSLSSGSSGSSGGKSVKLPKTYSAPKLPELNHSQVNAVKYVLQNEITLIQGPPGTGKTITSATICYHLAKKSSDQILVCAPSNVAVDQLAEKIHKTGLKVVRMCAKSREAVETPVEFLTLHYLLKHLDEKSEFSKLLKKRSERGGELSAMDGKRFRIEKRKAERQILRAADVICCTCVGSGDPRMNGFKFKRVIIDESTQSTEPECLIPIIKGSKKIILVGDHCQLGPVIMCKKSSKAGLARSLFERLVMLGIRPLRLQVQYRMHPCLSEFPSNTFYEGTLQNGVTTTDRLITNISFPWPVPSKPMFFYNSVGEEEFSNTGTSYLNRVEAAMVEKVVTALLKAGIVPHQLGVITPYEGQRSYVVKHMLRSGSLRSELYKSIEVASVDSFQGREKDFIILSCVRSNSRQGIGFLNNPRRLNVALTRSKCGLIIVGNAKVLSKHPLWNTLLNHFKKNDCVVEGPLNHMKKCTMNFPKPKRFVKQFFSNHANWKPMKGRSTLNNMMMK